jgi:hypothetical protein
MVTLQQCVQDGLSCGSVANGVVNILGTGCACATGLVERFDSTGKLISCQAAETPTTVFAQSGTRTNITLPYSSGPILAVFNSSNGGKTAVVSREDGTMVISYLSR